MAAMAPRAPEAFDPEPPNDPAVEAEFQAAPGIMVVEIIDGELHTRPRPARRHARAASILGHEITGPFDRGHGGPGGWVILDEPELHLGRRPDKLVPDLAGWRRERMPDLFEGDGDPAHFDLAPDWVCQVLSPRTESTDRAKKMRIYRREKLGHVWLLNPVLRTLEIYRLESGRWSQLDVHEGDRAVKAEPFDAIDLDLGALWKG